MKKSSIKNKHAVNLLSIWCRTYWMWINKITLPIFGVQAGSNCWLQYWLIFSKPAKFYSVNIYCKINCFNYGINIAQFMPIMHNGLVTVSLQLFSVVWIFPRSLGVICCSRWVPSEGHKNYFKDWCLMDSQITFLFFTNF